MAVISGTLGWLFLSRHRWEGMFYYQRIYLHVAMCMVFFASVSLCWVWLWRKTYFFLTTSFCVAQRGVLGQQRQRCLDSQGSTAHPQLYTSFQNNVVEHIFVLGIRGEPVFSMFIAGETLRAAPSPSPRRFSLFLLCVCTVLPERDTSSAPLQV